MYMRSLIAIISDYEKVFTQLSHNNFKRSHPPTSINNSINEQLKGEHTHLAFVCRSMGEMQSSQKIESKSSGCARMRFRNFNKD